MYESSFFLTKYFANQREMQKATVMNKLFLRKLHFQESWGILQKVNMKLLVTQISIRDASQFISFSKYFGI